MTEPTKFFSSREPVESTRPHARKFVVNDEWHNDDVMKLWNGTAWQLPEKQEEQDSAKDEATYKDAADAGEQKQEEAEAAAQKAEAVSTRRGSGKKGGAK